MNTMGNEMNMTELNLDEMEMVNGGIIMEDGTLTSHEDIDLFCDVIDEIYDAFGADMAIAVAQSYLPYSPHVEPALRKGKGNFRNHLHVQLNKDDSTADRYKEGY